MGRSPLVLLLIVTGLPAETLHFTTLASAIIRERLERIPAKTKDRGARIRELFETVGCGKDLTEQPVKHSKAPNVVCTLPGEAPATVVVGAHFDKAEAGAGAVDNWTGASMLPSLYQSLVSRKPRFTFVFVAFTDEEKGLVGSKSYADGMTKDQAAATRAMVNLDSLGLSSTKIWMRQSDQRLRELLIRLASSMKLPVDGVNVDNVGSSDSESFARRRIPVITIHSVTQDTWPILHTSQDKLSAIKFDDYYDSYRLLAAYLAFLDQSLAPGITATRGAEQDLWSNLRLRAGVYRNARVDVLR